jgi:hypothetical protein
MRGTVYLQLPGPVHVHIKMCLINTLIVRDVRGDTRYDTRANAMVLEKLRELAKNSHVLLSGELWSLWDPEYKPTQVCRTWLLGATPPTRVGPVYMTPSIDVLDLIEPFDKTWWVLGDLTLLHTLSTRTNQRHVLSM